MLENMSEKAVRGVRCAALGAAGLGLATIGAGFLTAALFMVLSALRDPAFAALVVGLIYAGAGFLLLAMARRQPRKSPDSERRVPDPADTMGVLVTAFLKGFNSGKAARGQ